MVRGRTSTPLSADGLRIEQYGLSTVASKMKLTLHNCRVRALIVEKGGELNSFEPVGRRWDVPRPGTRPNPRIGLERPTGYERPVVRRRLAPTSYGRPRLRADETMAGSGRKPFREEKVWICRITANVR